MMNFIGGMGCVIGNIGGDLDHSVDTGKFKQNYGHCRIGLIWLITQEVLSVLTAIFQVNLG